MTSIEQEAARKRVKELEALVVHLLNQITRLGSQTGNVGWGIIRDAQEEAKKHGFSRVQKDTSEWTLKRKP